MGETANDPEVFRLKSEALARFAVDYINEQIATKAKCRTYGNVLIQLNFRRGHLYEVEVEDKTKMRADLFEVDGGGADRPGKKAERPLTKGASASYSTKERVGKL